MQKIKIPDEINYIELYFTLKCNLGCEYCINKFSDVKRVRCEQPYDVLAHNINRLDFNLRPLTIGGGEPTTRSDFFKFVNTLDPEIKIDLLTNLQFDIDEFIDSIPLKRFYSFDLNKPAYKSIRVSYHPTMMNPYKIIEKVVKLQEYGYSVGVFGINHPLSIEDNVQMSEIARNHKVYFFIKDFLGPFQDHTFGFFHDKEGLSGIKKDCQCRTKELLIDPTGNIFKCHRDLYANEFPISNISDLDLSIEFKYRKCSMFGLCNPCDLKIKTNRFLQLGHNSTDISFDK